MNGSKDTDSLASLCANLAPLQTFLELLLSWRWGGLGHFMVQKKGHPNGSVLEENFRPGWRLLGPLEWQGRRVSLPWDSGTRALASWEQQEETSRGGSPLLASDLGSCLAFPPLFQVLAPPSRPHIKFSSLRLRLTQLSPSSDLL